MSSETRVSTLSEYSGRSEAPETVADESDENATSWAQNENATSTTSACLNCGAHITPDFARVFGDNDDAVHECLECSENLTDIPKASRGGI